jgi:hypothetical protein
MSWKLNGNGGWTKRKRGTPAGGNRKNYALLNNRFCAISATTRDPIVPLSAAAPSHHLPLTGATHRGGVQPIRRDLSQALRDRRFPSLPFRASYSAPFSPEYDRKQHKCRKPPLSGNIAGAVSELCVRPFCCFDLQGKPCCSGTVHSNSNTAPSLLLVIGNRGYGFLGMGLNLLIFAVLPIKSEVPVHGQEAQGEF